MKDYYVAQVNEQLLRAESAEARLEREWRPIETAPKDETRVLTVVSGFQPAIGWWSMEHGRWVDIDPDVFDDAFGWEEYLSGSSYEPTHWMPLPPSPKEEKDG